MTSKKGKQKMYKLTIKNLSKSCVGDFDFADIIIPNTDNETIYGAIQKVLKEHFGCEYKSVIDCNKFQLLREVGFMRTTCCFQLLWVGLESIDYYDPKEEKEDFSNLIFHLTIEATRCNGHFHIGYSTMLDRGLVIPNDCVGWVLNVPKITEYCKMQVKEQVKKQVDFNDVGDYKGWKIDVIEK